MPTTLCRDERISLFGPPGARAYNRTMNRVMVLQHSIDYFPSGFNCILPGKERAVAFHGVTQKPFVRRFLSRLLV